MTGSFVAINLESGEQVQVASPWKVDIPAHDLRVYRMDHEETAQK